MKQQHTLYTFGYLQGNVERVLKELEAFNTPIVDIRYSPTSRNWRYTQRQLQGRLGTRYYHIIELGNENYKNALNGDFQEDAIKLHNPGVGLAKLKTILDAHGNAAIFCACSSKKTCHRITVATLVEAQFGVKVYHL